MNKLRQRWGNLRSSFWFMPSLIVVDSIVVALAFIEADSAWGDHLRAQWPRLFGVGAEAGQSHQKSHTTQDLSKVCFVPTGFEPLVFYPQLFCLLLLHCVHRNVTQQGQVLGCITLTHAAVIFA